MRVGNKKPAMTIVKTVKTDSQPVHVATANKTVTGGEKVHGMPLMSAAAAKQSH